MPDCWSVRPNDDGALRMDGRRTVDDPERFTTIAWRLAHMTSVLGGRANWHFGDRSHVPRDMDCGRTANETLHMLDDGYAAWVDGVQNAPDGFFDKISEGPPGSGDFEYPFAMVIPHISRETIHHGAEVSLLRDLYGATQRSRS